MSTTATTVVSTLAALLFLTTTIAHTVHDMKKLIDDKNKTYNKHFRPVFNQDETVYVTASFDLISIQEFDEVAEKFSVNGFLDLGWQDQLLAWDPNDYGNMTAFAAKGLDFWKPNFVLVNAFADLNDVGNDWNIYRYFSDGSVSVSPGAVFEATCSVDITRYPWDEQVCSLDFMSFGYIGREVTIVSTENDIGTNLFGGNGKWDLVDTSVSSIGGPGFGVSIIKFTMQLRRKPLFVLVNVIMPIVFMSILNMIVFLIPTDSGERISYCLTVLLAIAVFITLVSENLPKTSTSISILSYYLLSVLTISTWIIVATVFSLRVYFRDERKPVPECLAALVRCLGCKCKREIDFSHKYRRSHNAPDYEPDDREPSPQHWRAAGVYVTNGIPVRQHYHGVAGHSHVSSRHRHNAEAPEDPAMSDEEDEVSWKDVSCTVDIICFAIFVCCLITATTVCFVLMLN